MKSNKHTIMGVIGAIITAAGICFTNGSAAIGSSMHVGRGDQKDLFAMWIAGTVGTAIGAGILAFALIKSLAAHNK